MERGNFIEVKKAVDDVTGAFDNQLASIREAIKLLNDLGSAYKSAIPSQFLSESQKVTTSVVQQEKAVDDLSKAQQNLNKISKETLADFITTTSGYRNIAGSLRQLSTENQKYRMQLTAVRREIRMKEAEMKRSGKTSRDVSSSIAELRVREVELNLAVQESNKSLRQYVKELNSAEGSMVQMSQTLLQLKELYSGLSVDERNSPFGQKVQGDIARLDSELKKLDGNIGQYGRNVGNYAKQWDGLHHETNQLVREIPAMAYGVNVFFSAISNNLPLFIDQVKLAREQQKIAIAEGKEAPSVMSRITASLFNWQTAIILGITYLTMHGKEVVNWVKSLWGASSALEELSKRQDEFNSAQLQGRKSAQAEIIELRKNLAVIKDKNVADDLRATAIKQLRDLYPRYFKDLKDEEIGTWKSGMAVHALTEALEKRKEVEKKTDLNVLNRQRLIELESEIEAIDSVISKNEELSKNQLKLSTTTEGLNVYEQRLNSAYRDKENLLAEQAEINKNIISNEEDIIRLRKETIALDWREEKSKKSSTKATYEYIDALASEYRLKVLYYEKEIEMNNSIFEDETVGYDQRVIAMKKMYDDQEVLSGIHRKEQLRLLEISNKEQQQEAKKAHLEGIIDEKQYFYALEQIRADFINNDAIINKEHETRLKEINDERSKGYDAIIKRQWEYLKNLNDISRLEQNRSVSNVSNLEQATFDTILKDYEEYQKKRTEIANESEIERLNLRLKDIDIEMSALESSSDEYQKLVAEKIQAENSLNAIKQKHAEEEAQRLQKLALQYKAFVQGFQNDVLSGFPAIMTMISDEFQGMIQGLIDEGEFGRAAVAIGVQMIEAFQDMYNMLQQNSDAYYKRQFEVLEMQKDIAIKYAGESVVAREEVERQYEERRKQIERQRAKQQKENAIFNAIINTAQAVVSTLASAPWPANIPMAALVGALGAAQIAMIASQPLPAYEHGTLNHGGGLMLINDGKGSNFKEKVITPDGKIHSPQKRNTIMNAPKGTMVLNHNQWRDFNRKVMDNGITSYAPVNSGITKEDLKEVFNSSYSGNREITNVSIDRSGINATIIRGSMKVKKLNNRIRIKSN